MVTLGKAGAPYGPRGDAEDSKQHVMVGSRRGTHASDDCFLLSYVHESERNAHEDRWTARSRRGNSRIYLAESPLMSDVYAGAGTRCSVNPTIASSSSSIAIP